MIFTKSKFDIWLRRAKGSQVPAIREVKEKVGGNCQWQQCNISISLRQYRSPDFHETNILVTLLHHGPRCFLFMWPRGSVYWKRGPGSDRILSVQWSYERSGISIGTLAGYRLEISMNQTSDSLLVSFICDYQDHVDSTLQQFKIPYKGCVNDYTLRVDSINSLTVNLGGNGEYARLSIGRQSTVPFGYYNSTSCYTNYYQFGGFKTVQN